MFVKSRHTFLVLTAVFCIGALLTSCGPKKHITATSTEYKQQASKSDGKSSKEDNNRRKDNKTTTKPSRHAQALITEARRWIGTPYRYGGKEKSGTDCSGFVMQVFSKALDISLPRSSQQQHEYCRRIDKAELIPGDLVFFSSKAGSSKTSHVGLYIGDGVMIHASTSSGVIESSIESNYYITHYNGAGRVPQLDDIGKIGAVTDNNTVKVIETRTETVVEAETPQDKGNAGSSGKDAKKPKTPEPTKDAEAADKTVKNEVTNTPSPESIVKNAFNKK